MTDIKPLGYIDAEQIRRWEALRGTQYETSERCYMPWSSTPFKSDMSDCSMPVYSESALSQAREEGRLAGLREARAIASMFSMKKIPINPDISVDSMNETARTVYHATCQCVAMEIDRAITKESEVPDGN